VKWDLKYQKERGIKSAAAEDLPDGAAQQITRICKRIYRGLGLTGYARIDLRMTAEGRVYVLEAKPESATGPGRGSGGRGGGGRYPLRGSVPAHRQVGLSRSRGSVT
jgi:D-alanine-D-alanine ligase